MKESFQTPLGKVFSSSAEVYQTRISGNNFEYICLPVVRLTGTPTWTAGALMTLAADGLSVELLADTPAEHTNKLVVVCPFTIATGAAGICDGYAWFLKRGVFTYALATGSFAPGVTLCPDATNLIEVMSAALSAHVFIDGAFVLNTTNLAIKVFYDNPRAVYVAADAGITSLALNDLSDVTITSASSTQTLRYNGSAWVNVSSAVALDDLSDVTITTPSNTQVLKYNGSAWVNATDAVE